MSIRLRLLLSYIAMLVIPVVLSVAVAVCIIIFSASHTPSLQFMVSPEKILRQGSVIFSEVKQTADNNPERLKNMDYLEGLDRKLAVLNTGVIIEENGVTIYESGLFKGTRVSEGLQRLREHRGNHGHREDEGDHNPLLDAGWREPIIMDRRAFLIRQHDFAFKDKTAGTVFLVTDVSPVGEFARKVIFSMAIAVLLILIFTDGILTFLVSRSIVKPLETLKHGAEQIKEGNLDFEIKYKSNDEIGKLAAAFEEMRRKLKSSVELQLQYENNRKELISSISHDLKTPVTAIKGYVEGIIDGVPDTQEKMDKYIQTIYTKANDLDRLIDELFLFSKLDLKKLPFNFEEVAIKDYLRDCTEELRLDLEEKQVDLSFNSVVDGEVKVIADREKLKRVIVNIIQNAVKYMDKERGKISLSLQQEQDTVIIKIEDNGRGISEQALPMIFDSFYRADLSRNASTGGSGLGLAIAKRIIEGHGGRIWAESIEGIGTSIFFTLRRVQNGEMGL